MDEILNRMHEEDKIKWIIGPTLFRLLVFYVDRYIISDKLGEFNKIKLRAIRDVWGLNTLIINNLYPLLL